MSPQFVDFDADGKLDVVAGTYAASPFVARGNGKSWQQPEQILDANGKRIVLNAFWNYDTKKWDKVDANEPDGHLTSAVLFDWDGDGDHDLLLGDHSSGRIWRRDNGGTASKAAFGGKNLPVDANGAPIDVPGTVATMRVLDWNRDGLMDLLVSSMGDTWNDDQQGGGVWLYVNAGSKADTRFGAPLELLPQSKKGAAGAPKRPDSGLYADAGDVDGDGDFDLVIGGYSHWKPTAPVLTAEQKQRVDELTKLLAAVDKKLDAWNDEMSKAIQALPAAERDAKYKDVYESKKAQRDAIMKERTPLFEEREQLVPSAQRVGFVWLYENTTPAAKSN